MGLNGSVGAFTFKTSERFSIQQILTSTNLPFLNIHRADFGPADVKDKAYYNTEVSRLLWVMEPMVFFLNST